MPKPFLTYAQQIGLLKSKNLQIDDASTAIQVLSQIGYFSLIGGYKHLFKNPTTQNYRDGVSFSDIVALYHYDEELRHLFLRYLLIIERDIKTKIAYAFCAKYGDGQVQYLSIGNYDNNPTKHMETRKHKKKHRKLATQPTDYPYINHQRSKYGNVPLWVLINALTFGSASKMFGFLPQSLQSQICRNYPLTIPQLERILAVLTKYRNACAHGERVFSYTTRDDIPDLSLHKKLRLVKRGNQYVCGKHDLFAVVISFRYLLSSDDFRRFKSDLEKRIVRFTKECITLSETELLSEMGFPLNWLTITRFRIQ